jgi:hypothetical protein
MTFKGLYARTFKGLDAETFEGLDGTTSLGPQRPESTREIHTKEIRFQWYLTIFHQMTLMELGNFNAKKVLDNVRCLWTNLRLCCLPMFH